MHSEIYLFRHGQTTFNRDQRFTGWKDAKLTDLGKKQAQQIGQKLKTKRIDVAICSSLSRSKETLAIVLKQHPECQVVLVDDRMIERSYGKLEGRTHNWFIEHEGKDDYHALLHDHKINHLTGKQRLDFIKEIGKAELQLIRRSHNTTPPGGESISMVEKRVTRFISDLIKKLKKKKMNVAICAHGNSIRAFRKIMEHLPVEKEMKIEIPWDDYFLYTIPVTSKKGKRTKQ